MTRHSPMAIQNAADHAMARARLVHDEIPKGWTASTYFALALLAIDEAPGVPPGSAEVYNRISALLDAAVDRELDSTTDGREDAAHVAERVAAGMAEE